MLNFVALYICYLDSLGQIEMKPDINRWNNFKILNICIGIRDFISYQTKSSKTFCKMLTVTSKNLFKTEIQDCLFLRF